MQPGHASPCALLVYRGRCRPGMPKPGRTRGRTAHCRGRASGTLPRRSGGGDDLESFRPEPPHALGSGGTVIDRNHLVTAPGGGTIPLWLDEPVSSASTEEPAGTGKRGPRPRATTILAVVLGLETLGMIGVTVLLVVELI